MKVDLIVTT